MAWRGLGWEFSFQGMMIHGIHLAESCEFGAGAGDNVTASENQDFITERHEWYESTLELNFELLDRASIG